MLRSSFSIYIFLGRLNFLLIKQREKITRGPITKLPNKIPQNVLQEFVKIPLSLSEISTLSSLTFVIEKNKKVQSYIQLARCYKFIINDCSVVGYLSRHKVA